MSERVLVVGGLSRSLINFRGPLLDSLRERGHEVLAAAPEDGDAPTVRRELGAKGIELHAIPMARGGTNPIRDLATLRALRRLICQQRPTAVIAYTAKPVIYSGLAIRSEDNIRFFPMITGLGYAFTDGHGIRRRVLQRLVRELYRRGLAGAETVIFQNPDDQALFHERGLVPSHATSVRVYGSGVDMQQFPQQPLQEAPIFLMLARLLVDKGVREYAEAARTVRAQLPEARFLLAGPVDPNPSAIDQAELEQWSEEGVIEYLGSLDDVSAALGNCRYYVLPSYREGTPRSVLEAMATGRPVITTDVPGCRETVEHGRNGLLVEPRDADALAEAMLELLQMPKDEVERMGEESTRLVRERFDVHRVNESILAATGL